MFATRPASAATTLLLGASLFCWNPVRAEAPATPASAPKAGCEINATPPQACELLFYAKNGNPVGLARSLDKGLDINTRDQRGATPLLLALLLPRATTDLAPGLQNDSMLKGLIERKIKAAHLLLDKGADVNAGFPDGLAPLHVAAGDPRLLEFIGPLVAKGARLNQQGGQNRVTPLLAAIERKNAAAVTTLLDAGADPNAVMAKGITPLLSACLSGDAATAALLLKHGAKPDLADEHGLTPMLAASSQGNADLVKLLQQAGAAAPAASSSGAVAQ